MTTLVWRKGGRFISAPGGAAEPAGIIQDAPLAKAAQKNSPLESGLFFSSGGEDGNRTRLNGFAGRCITSLLPRQRNCLVRLAAHLENWSGRRVSNSRPQPWQGCALPTELLPRHQQQASIIEGLQGLSTGNIWCFAKYLGSDPLGLTPALAFGLKRRQTNAIGVHPHQCKLPAFSLMRGHASRK